MIELIGQIVALMLILMFVRRPADVSLALLFSGVGPFALSVCGIGLTVFETRPQQIPAVGEVIERLAASFPLFLVRLSSTGFTMSAAWIASLLTGPRETAYFGIAAKIASALTTFSQPVLFALLPNISRAATISRYSALRMSLRWGGALVALGVFSVASVYLFADLFIKLLFAKDMAPAAEITRALAWICIIAAFRDTLGDLVLVPLRRDKAVAVCVVVGSAVGLISAFTLAPTFGAYGMVAARLLGEVMVVALMAISLFLYLRKKR
jgi:O-antigen/teichoic acid export membrane protein